MSRPPKIGFSLIAKNEDNTLRLYRSRGVYYLEVKDNTQPTVEIVLFVKRRKITGIGGVSSLSPRVINFLESLGYKIDNYLKGDQNVR
ncbi:MAG: hypothetical protein QW046_05030 [Candidatus Micrarchaeaceae archaeon]